MFTLAACALFTHIFFLLTLGTFTAGPLVASLPDYTVAK